MVGGGELAGSSSTTLGEKTASFSKNAVLGFRFFPARFRALAPDFPPVGRKTHRVKVSEKRRPVSRTPGTTQRSQPGEQVWAESLFSNSALFETLSFLRPTAA